VITFHYETGKTKRVNLWSYVKTFEPTREYVVDEFLDGLKEAVEESYYGYRQRGVFLSGGLDSTSVAHYLNAKNTFTSSYNKTSKASINSDAVAAKRFAEDKDYNHTDILITQENFMESIEESMEALEMPVYNKSTPSYWYINKKLKEAGTVITYSGDGGDEMYCGYGTHDRYLKQGTKDPYRAHYRAIAWKRDSNNKVDENAYVDYMKEWFPENVWGSDWLNNCLFVETITRVSEDFLSRNDKFGAYFGMEGRFPLLNLKWFEYIMSIPSSVKMKHGGEGKYIAREALKKVLPDYIVNKDKTGWKIPHTEWHRTPEFRNKMSKIICEPLGNDIDKIVNWPAQVNGVKTFYAFAFLKKWMKKYGITL
jgi:asparagine synthase (glutamine-hydrolysing)